MLSIEHLAPLTFGKLRAHELPCVAALLGEAFADNPCYAYMHPRASTRPRDLRAFFERNLHWHAPYDLTWVVRDGQGRPVATATLEPPGGVTGSLSSMLSVWLWPTLRAQGLHTMTRISRTADAFTEHNRRVAGGSAFWHVHAVAVAPSAQGHGVGTMLMTQLLDALTVLRKNQPAPVVLSTQKPSNVRFYQRFGFELREQVKMGRSLNAKGFDSWFLQLAADL